METKTFVEQIGLLCQEVADRRAEIKEEYIKAWLSTHIYPDLMTDEWLKDNLELVETWSQDRRSVAWSLRRKYKP